MDFNYTTEDTILNLDDVSGVDVQLDFFDVCVLIFIIVANLALVLLYASIIKNGVSLKTSHLFIGNGVMADLVTIVGILLDQYYPDPFSTDLSCSIGMGMIIASTIAFVYTYGLIAVDRFLFIAHGMKYNRWMYPKSGCLLIVSTWILGTILGLLPTTGLWTETTEGDKIPWLGLFTPPDLIDLITDIEMIPISLGVISYGIILYHAIKKQIQLRRADRNRTDETASGDNAELRIFRGGKSVKNDDAKKTAKNKLSKIEAVSAVLFLCAYIVFTWIQYVFASHKYVFCDSIDYCKEVKLLFAGMSSVNFFLDPVISGSWDTGVTNFMKKLVCKE
ncbi:glucose-dependent insulinotropic receptor-like isoform X3 [Neodiprion virginianus]|uniref:glucose-dependent insulinotropic receptor-like isoform X3 n=1 Tax=Neodiprion virginianus TaxID=2961670 RepID=UPI001EE74585|nr:glucose-dependent insulinotropic receptor-like isoform X3 [Neodiprion virginianus]